MTREEILAIRATGLALVAQCDAALSRPEMAPTLAAWYAPSAQEVTAASLDSMPLPHITHPASMRCPHPADRVISTAVSGEPHRKKCTACGMTVEQVPA